MNTAAHPDDPRHLAICTVCQTRARTEAGELGIDLYRVWSRVAVDVWRPEPRRFERTATRVLRSPGLSRALVTTPSLLLSWIGASIVILIVGIVATQSSGTPWAQLLAPVIAAIGIAYAYGPGIDPAFELSRSLAISDRMVLLVRALAVFAINAGLGAIASLAVSSATGVTFAWLAPMTAISALALAVAVWTHSPATGVAVALAVWGVIVLAGQTGAGDVASVLATALIPLYLLAAAACAAVAVIVTAGKHERTSTWA